MTILECNSPNINQVLHFGLIQFELLSRLLNKLDCSILFIVSCNIPQLSSGYQPFTVLLLEVSEGVGLENMSHLLVLKSDIDHDVLEESKCLLVGLLIVEVLPIGEKFLFDLIEYLFERCFLRRIFHF